MKNMIIYVSNLESLDGIYTWILDFVRALRTDYDITVMTKQWNPHLRDELASIVNTSEWEENQQYATDILLSMYDFKDRPQNIKADKSYTILHCDYGGIDYKIPPSFSDKGNYIAVSKYVADNFSRRFNIPCDYVEGLMKPKPNPKKVLRLISCTRLSQAKGSERMKELCRLLKANDIRYTWDNYSAGGIMNLMYRNRDIAIRKCCPNDELLDYIADADYLVQLSESEGYCRAVHEALLVGTPVIVSDIPIFQNVVVNGYNGYRVPLDMKGINIRKIAENVPNTFICVDRYQKTKAEWLKIL